MDDSPQPELRARILIALALVDGQSLEGYDLKHTAEVQYGKQADAMLSIFADLLAEGYIATTSVLVESLEASIHNPDAAVLTPFVPAVDGG